MTPSQTGAMFQAFSAEFAAMGESIEGLSGLFSEHVRQLAAEDRPRVLYEAQALDELAQRLDALRSLATDLARGERVEVALDCVPLADLADRIREAVLISTPERRPKPVAGDMILFE